MVDSKPRSLELFTYLKIIDSVMKKAILTPPVRMYKMPEGVDVLHEFDMAPHREATPSHPFVRRSYVLFSCMVF